MTGHTGVEPVIVASEATVIILFHQCPIHGTATKTDKSVGKTTHAAKESDPTLTQPREDIWIVTSRITIRVQHFR